MLFSVTLVLALLITTVTAAKLNLLKAANRLFKRTIPPLQSKFHLTERCVVEDIDTAPSLFHKNPQARKITKSYLQRKFFNTCDGKCLVQNDREEIARLLQEILPPVTKEELDYEIFEILQKFGSRENMDTHEFFDILISNSYWLYAGEVIVKEFIYLDVLRSLQQNAENPLLSDECINKLKSDLEWNGSPVVHLSGEEALYLFAVSCQDQRKPIIDESEFQELREKLELKESQIGIYIDRVKSLQEQNIHNSVVEYLFKYPVSNF